MVSLMLRPQIRTSKYHRATMLIDMNRSWHRLTQRSVMPTDVALRLKGHAGAYQQPGCLDRKCTTNRADSIVSARHCIRVFYEHKRLPNTRVSGVSPFNPGHGGSGCGVLEELSPVRLTHPGNKFSDKSDAPLQ